MKYIKTYEKMYFKDKIKMIIPESYLIFSYNSYDFKDNKYYDFLILGKIKSLPYEKYANSFVDIIVISFITNKIDKKLYKNAFNIDMLKPIKRSNSLEQIKIFFEEEKEKWNLKNNMNKYNL